MIPPTSRIIGIPIHMTTLDGAISLAEAMIREGRRGYFCHVDTNAALAAHDSPAILSALQGATLACPDGMPLVWIGRQRGFPVGRTYGPDFMEGLTERTAAWGDRTCRHFLFGSSQAVLDRLAASLAMRAPGIQIAGMLSPPFGTWDEATEAEHRRLINDSGADVVWVSLGAPRQELWMQRNRPHLEASLLSGVGAAFDFLSGNKPQAPKALQRAGLEWAFRLATEPRRLARRYFRNVPRFAYLAVKEELSGGR